MRNRKGRFWRTLIAVRTCFAIKRETITTRYFGDANRLRAKMYRSPCCSVHGPRETLLENPERAKRRWWEAPKTHSFLSFFLCKPRLGWWGLFGSQARAICRRFMSRPVIRCCSAESIYTFLWVCDAGIDLCDSSFFFLFCVAIWNKSWKKQVGRRRTRGTTKATEWQRKKK